MLTSLCKSILDLLLPRYCISCGERLHKEENGICLMCNTALPRTYHWKSPEDNDIFMRLYGRSALADDKQQACQAAIQKAVSYIYFTPKSDIAKIVYEFKYNDNPKLARDMGEMMAKEIGPDFFKDIDALIPVPITKSKLHKRGYNQTEMIARGISSVTSTPICNNIIKRTHNDSSQTKLSFYERADNIKGVFQLNKSKQLNIDSKGKVLCPTLAGKHIMIVEDIITTGATMLECINVLSNIPGIKISVISWGCIRQ